MFWWCCGDFSNMSAIFGKTVKAHNEDGQKKEPRPGNDERFTSIFTYNSAEHFAANRYGAFNDDPSPHNSLNALLNDSDKERGTSDLAVEYAFTALSSTLLLLTMPFSLFFSLKFVGPFERLVVMRLGRTRGVYGQGTVLLLPLVDKATIVDLRVTSIELPSIHIVTSDRGMLEVVAVAYTKITDPLTVCCALQNREQTLHSLAYTTLTRHLAKRLLNDLTSPASLAKILIDCQDELNCFLRPHGIQVDRLTVNQLRVLKPAENTAVSVFQTIMKSDIGKQLIGKVGAHFHSTIGETASTAGDEPKEVEARGQEYSSSSTLAMAGQGGPNGIINSPGRRQQSNNEDATFLQPIISIDSELDSLIGRIRVCLDAHLVQKIGRHFRILCTDLGTEFDIDLRNGRGWCGWTCERTFPSAPDVHFTLNKSTLIALVEGALSPMSAYLDGLVQIRGSIQDVISLKYLAEFARQSNVQK